MGAAVELESIEMMRILLSHGADVSLPWVTAAGRAVLAPLHAAAEQGQLNAVRFLLDHGADLELPREDHDPCSAATRHFSGNGGATPLWLACYGGHVSTATLLHSRGAKLEVPDDIGWTPLHAACFEGHDEVVRFLLEHGVAVQPHAPGWKHYTPLLLACNRGHCEVVRLLHAGGASLEKGVILPGKKETTPFELAYNNGRSEVVKYLRDVAYAPVAEGERLLGSLVCAINRCSQESSSESPPHSPQPKQSRPKRSTPIRERAKKAGVSHKLQATPPDVRATIAAGSSSSAPVKAAKIALHRVQRANQQLVAPAELQQPRNATKRRELSASAAKEKRKKRHAPEKEMQP